jgi:hypothetical protein
MKVDFLCYRVVHEHGVYRHRFKEVHSLPGSREKKTEATMLRLSFFSSSDAEEE